MMKTSLLFAAFFALLSGLSAQGINYQALARDAGGNPLTSQAIVVEISIFPDQISATSLYQETHTLTTDDQGLFSLVIGEGTPTQGIFGSIGWHDAPLSLGIRLDAGSGFTDLGRYTFQGTPFSFYAREAGRATDMELADLNDVQSTSPANGQVLKWNGTAWVPATDANTAYTAGSGISISGSSISNTGDLSSTNELQTLSISGNQLSISNGNSVSLATSSIWSTNGTSATYNTGNVGVGTNTPHNRIHLHNSDPFSGSPSALQLTNTGSGSAAGDGLLLTINSTIADYGLIGGLMMRETTALGLGTNGNYHLFLKGNGLVGLGTFTPQGKMEIEHNSTNHTDPNLTITHATNGYGRISFRSDDAATKYWTLASRTNASDAASQFNLYYNNGTSGENILSINGDGNVGVGNITPSEKFQVDGNARVVKLGINTSPVEPLDVNGNVRISGEVNRPSTGSANMIPICYGNVSGTGVINTGSGNFTVAKTGSGEYEITITGENYLFSSYVGQAALYGNAGFISTTSVNGKMVVKTYNLGVGAVPTDRNFSFIVFKP